MAHVDRNVREALGLNFDPDAVSVREALLRSARLQPPTFSVPRRIEEWFVTVANVLGGLTPGDPKPAAVAEAGEECLRPLHAWMAPAVLAMIAPDRSAPTCSARGLLTECQAEVRMQLPIFFGRVLAQWRDGALRHEWADD